VPDEKTLAAGEITYTVHCGSGAGAFVFSAEHECRQLFGVDPRAEDFVDRHADLVANLLLQH
jgi:hypothetical protein